MISDYGRRVTSGSTKVDKAFDFATDIVKRRADAPDVNVPFKAKKRVDVYGEIEEPNKLQNILRRMRKQAAYNPYALAAGGVAATALAAYGWNKYRQRRKAEKRFERDKEWYQAMKEKGMRDVLEGKTW